MASRLGSSQFIQHASAPYNSTSLAFVAPVVLAMDRVNVALHDVMCRLSQSHLRNGGRPTIVDTAQLNVVKDMLELERTYHQCFQTGYASGETSWSPPAGNPLVKKNTHYITITQAGYFTPSCQHWTSSLAHLATLNSYMSIHVDSSVAPPSTFSDYLKLIRS